MASAAYDKRLIRLYICIALRIIYLYIQCIIEYISCTYSSSHQSYTPVRQLGLVMSLKKDKGEKANIGLSLSIPLSVPLSLSVSLGHVSLSVSGCSIFSTTLPLLS